MKHGLTGQPGNALKHDEPASAVLTVRVTPADKEQWFKLAQKKGVTLSEWVIERLNHGTT